MAATERTAVPVRLMVALAVALAPVVTGAIYGLSTAFLVGAALMLGGVIVLLWSSVQSLTGEAPMTLDEAFSLAAPSAEEERKRAVLRALKDLEYERSVGKISDDDYQTLSARYRSEAKELLRIIDAARETRQAHIERLLQKRLHAGEAKAAAEAKAADTRAADTKAAAEDDFDEDDVEPTDEAQAAEAEQAARARRPKRKSGPAKREPVTEEPSTDDALPEES
jgi:hypothetical protein